ncbi:hypothetical protein ACFYT3_25185 [Nocardia amikacinitolerans]|uniref:hypothetical protein n=1 Tax=Nocardia amikacinitolerans TaxID=756689 RepID=UPI0020A37823|nr:hypothetical protein [Nocardia amikacinitolerans]MCP2289466.1 hypothetical protein [Nocardia amikacinitolerans]
MGSARELLAGVGIPLLVFAAVAFVLAASWRIANPPGTDPGRWDRKLTDLGLVLAAVGIVASVAGLVPVRSPGDGGPSSSCSARAATLGWEHRSTDACAHAEGRDDDR